MNTPRKIAVVTGSRAEYGLLETVLDAIDVRPELELLLIVSGSHLLPAVHTVTEITEQRSVVAQIPMQESGKCSPIDDALSVARGIRGCIEAFQKISPDIVLVLGDRIEVFAAASAASIGGYTLAHIHGGDRAEGVADEAMRHAITKLSHIHFPATEESATRIRQMGELEKSIHLVGSPAVDGVNDIAPINAEDYAELGSPRTIFLMHGTGAVADADYIAAKHVLEACMSLGPVLVLAPNTDPGGTQIRRAIEECTGEIHITEHLPRHIFVSALRRVDALVGNSSAGLIEAAIVGCPAVNVGPRQNGRERAGNVIDVADANEMDLRTVIGRVAAVSRNSDHPYGNGHSGERIAEVLCTAQISIPPRKRNSY